MRKNVICLATVAALSLTVGCEWESSSDGDSWNDAYSWVNFSGVYRPAGGNSFVVLSFTPPAGTPASTATTSQSIGTSDGLTASYSGTLGNTPIVADSVSVTAGGTTLTDDESGNLSGPGGASGTVNYSTGAIVVNFAVAPAAGVNVIVTYHYSVGGTSGGSTAGTSNPIHSITVSQTGQRLTFVDSNGVTYSGNVSSITQGGGDSSGLTSGTVVANFAVTASSGARITGTLQGDYTAPGLAADGTAAGSGALANRVLQGTYAAGGSTADVLGAAGSVDITVPTTGTGTTTDG